MKAQKYALPTAAALATALASLSHVNPERLLLATVCFIALWSTTRRR